MQPDRSCYIRREADEQLLESIAAQRFACVLAPRALGKSSLMGRTIRRLRADGQFAAVVDLSQIGSRADGVDSARWHYSIAYRICRELRLKIDLQVWWQERSLLLSEQRLVEFFLDVVLANTSAPVTVFFDGAERAADLPFASELFAALQSCALRRVSEPEYSRLNFVVLGSAAPEQLCPDPGVSPFVDATHIRLDDFTLAECAAFAAGLSDCETPAEILLERIYAWTHGQPYLTQKLARGVARKGGRLADVDAVVQELFLAPGISREEPLLNHFHASLGENTPRGRQAIRILARLGRGMEVIDDPASGGQLLLELAGLVSSDENGMLRFSNRIVEQIFDSDWARTLAREPDRWQRSAGLAVAALAVFVLLPYWYLSILPARDIATLQSVTNDFGLAIEAHQRLRRLPGFGGRADRLLTEVMVRRSTDAATIDEVRAADAELRALDGGAVIADALMADFWFRRGEAAARRGERDAALVHALAAAENGEQDAAALALSLVEGDYSNLERSFHFEETPAGISVDWARDRLVMVDEARRVDLMSLAVPRVEQRDPATPLTALQHVGITRTLFVDDPGRAGNLELSVTVEHPRSSDLLVRLRAPSGAAAELALRRREGSLEQFVLTGAAQSSLRSLADESITGTWELTVFDRLSGESGRLLGWRLRFPGVPQTFDEDLLAGIELPDPARTGQIALELAGDGRVGLAVPARVDARGAVAVWDLANGELIADLPLAGRASYLRMLDQDQFLVVGERRAALWRIDSTEAMIELVATNSYVATPSVSPDGQFFALAEWAGQVWRVTVFRTEDGAVVGRFDTAPWQDWALGAGGKLLALTDGSRRGRLLDPVGGRLVGEFFHERELDRVMPPLASGQLLAVDRAGDIVSWTATPGRALYLPRDSIYLGRTTAADSLAVSGNGSSLAYVDSDGMVVVRDPVTGAGRGTYSHGSARDLRAWLDADGGRLLTISDSLVRFWRVMPATPDSADFGEVSAVALGGDEGLGMLGYRSGGVRFLSGLPASLAESAEAGRPVVGHRAVVTSLAINSTGDLAASGASDGTVRIWNPATGMRRPVLLRHPSGPVTALAFSPDGSWLVSAGRTSARVFAVESGALVHQLDVEGNPLSVAFAADSRLVAVGDSAGNIYLATPGGTAGVVVIRGRSPITALAFGSEPGLLASGSRDGDLVFWDALTASTIERAYSLPAEIGWISITGDGTLVEVQSGDWLHAIDRGGSEPQHRYSRLLPASFRTESSFALIGDSLVRGLAITGGGQIAVSDIGLTAEPADTVELPARDWADILGLELDRTSGRIRNLDR